MGRRRKKRVEEPLTEDMLAELLDAPDPRAFIKRREVGERSLAEYLDALLLKKGLKRSERPVSTRPSATRFSPALGAPRGITC